MPPSRPPLRYPTNDDPELSSDALHIYTDGTSLTITTEAGTEIQIVAGAAACTLPAHGKLQSCAKVDAVNHSFNAELTGLAECFTILAGLSRTPPNVYIFCDCLGGTYKTSYCTAPFRLLGDKFLWSTEAFRQRAAQYPNTTFTFVKIKSQSGVPGNDRADELAKATVRDDMREQPPAHAPLARDDGGATTARLSLLAEAVTLPTPGPRQPPQRIFRGEVLGRNAAASVDPDGRGGYASGRAPPTAASHHGQPQRQAQQLGFF